MSCSKFSKDHTRYPKNGFKKSLFAHWGCWSIFVVTVSIYLCFIFHRFRSVEGKRCFIMYNITLIFVSVIDQGIGRIKTSMFYIILKVLRQVFETLETSEIDMPATSSTNIIEPIFNRNFGKTFTIIIAQISNTIHINRQSTSINPDNITNQETYHLRI